ncbi:MAG: GNAT family N-acetyltransferase [Clostridiales bacterium]|nr:GNAT family N-acetyltransferase [Clostridiales bacterium]
MLMFETLEGERIVLRKARAEDWESMLKNVWGDEEVYKWMLFTPTHTEEDARVRCERSIRFQSEHTAWFVALKDTDEAVGLCAINEYEKGHFEECGICVGTRFQGRGIGREIVKLLLELGFERLGAEDFMYGYFRENLRSKALAEKFGFHYDSTIEMVRPWDGANKVIDRCILTRAEYLAFKAGKNTRSAT